MSKESKLLVPQPRLKQAGVIALVSVMNMVAPLSTDMYLPALPNMAKYFNTNENIMNLTMTGFFLFFAIGMLIFGPISDKLGRKKPLAIGVLVYVLASIGCGLSVNVWMMIAFRICQALGGGCMVSVSMAIIKDSFAPNEQGGILAVSQVFSMIAPMVAPILGAWILRIFQWRATFFVLAIIGAAMLCLTILLKETLPQDKRLDVGVLRSISHLGKIAKNTMFTKYLIASAVFMLTMMAYIATSSYVYVGRFGLPETTYSLFFATAALCSILGPIAYVVARRMNPIALMFLPICVVVITGVLMFIIGSKSAVCYLVCIVPMMFFISITRPFTTERLLNMNKDDAGSASALINFGFSIFGTIGMFVITAVWTDYTIGVGTLMLISAVISAIFMLILVKQYGRHFLDRK